MPPLALLAAGLVILAGVVGLIRGTGKQNAATSTTSPSGNPIVVSGAWVREPASPDVAAAYLTIYNTTGTADTLESVTTGAGGESVIHADSATGMRLVAGGLVIPAHSRVTLSPGKGHVMIQKLYGTLKPGQTVNLELQFAKAGPVVVQAPVIAIGAPAPTASSGATK